MSKNIVLCLDGTADFAARLPTHVFRLFCELERSDEQVIYYDGGVGTLRNSHEVSWLRKRWSQLVDLGTGFSIREHFIQAYEFLCKHYELGDHVFVFGFSRGAYTARVLVGAVNKVGILYPEHLNLIPYVWQQLSELENATNKQWEDLKRLLNAFGRTLVANGNRQPEIHFAGLWDTVSAFGFGKLRTIPQTAQLSSCRTVRHAVSIDERRNMFPANRVFTEREDVEEVWFAGVHRDVGGGGKEESLGLSMFSYDWILKEASDRGLRIDTSPSHSFQRITPDAFAPDNKSLALELGYAALGLIPMKAWGPRTLQGKRKSGYRWQWLKFLHVRQIPNGAWVHHSVQQRMAAAKPPYRPKNLHQDIKWYP